ncbi:hypothetical protein DID75_01645 [Candidatus Marinamargulisbacteria bacterium SCGC AG-410-N11]|nr:hypothetical protein DID75_01645 [Candidatus Marinamargulisbacteria bacterium SCGC AG-410-N11]
MANFENIKYEYKNRVHNVLKSKSLREFRRFSKIERNHSRDCGANISALSKFFEKSGKNIEKGSQEIMKGVDHLTSDPGKSGLQVFNGIVNICSLGILDFSSNDAKSLEPATTDSFSPLDYAYYDYDSLKIKLSSEKNLIKKRQLLMKIGQLEDAIDTYKATEGKSIVGLRSLDNFGKPIWIK